jgi:hypothetical protein
LSSIASRFKVFRSVPVGLYDAAVGAICALIWRIRQVRRGRMRMGALGIVAGKGAHRVHVVPGALDRFSRKMPRP